MVPSYSRFPRTFESSPTTVAACGRGLRGDHAGLAFASSFRRTSFPVGAAFAGRFANAEGHF